MSANSAASPLPREIAFSKRKAPPVAPALKLRAAEVLRDYVLMARETYARPFPMPTLSFDLRGTTAGLAYCKEHHIQLNAVLFTENVEAFLTDTIPHELAHLVARRLHLPKQIQAHGQEWKQVMWDLGVEPSRCHDFDTTNSRTTQTFQYTCKCKTHDFGARRHNSARRGRTFRCRNCGQTLRFAGAPTKGATTTPSTMPRPAPTGHSGSFAGSRPPTDRMLDYLKSLAGKLRLPLPASALTDFRSCSLLIEAMKQALSKPSSISACPVPALNVPTEKQLSYAQSIASKKNLTIPASALNSKSQLSAWIDQYK